MNCYAERQAARFSGPGGPYNGLLTDKGRWNGQIATVYKHLGDPLRWTKARMVFVNSMSDLFHPRVPDGYRQAIYGVMAASLRHTFQVLTKRPELAAPWLSELETFGLTPLMECTASARARLAFSVQGKRGPRLRVPGTTWPPRNVWLGTSVENQPTADTRIPELLKCPAALRFISLEPMLGPVDLWPWLEDARRCLDWVIVGGESGPGARPCRLEWIRDVVEQCAEAGVPCFVKQLGRVSLRESYGQDTLVPVVMDHPKGGNPNEWPEPFPRQWPERSAA